MKNNSKKLIIWDFDGVIADTEVLWLSTRMELLNEFYNINWDLEKTNYHLGGMSDKTKIDVLNKLGINTNDKFWKKAIEEDLKKMLGGLPLTKNIADIFEMKEFDQCIATGGDNDKTAQKIKMVGIEKYFPPQKVFTADMVKNGKPEPDLFLLAAETMGYKPDECIVIEDSLAGIKAAIRAKMTPIAFTEYLKFSKNYFLEQMKILGIKHIFDNMIDVKKFLEENYL